MDRTNLAADALWSIYQEELTSGKTTLGWGKWLDEIRAFRPRLKPMVRFVRFALADARLYGA